MRARRGSSVVASIVLVAACSSVAARPPPAAGRGTTTSGGSPPATATVTTPSSTAAIPTTGAPATSAPPTLAPPTVAPATTGGAPSTAVPPQVFDADVAELPPANGGRIAVVVDDAGGPEGLLEGYLQLPFPLTISVIPWNVRPAVHAERAFAAGKEVTLHLPLANRRGNGDGRTRLAGTETPEQVEAFVVDAIARVPHAVGANNHEGPYGSAQPELMRPLLTSLQRHGLFFMDSVTSQRTVGFAVEAEMGMPPRINNVFLDHYETDEDSRGAVLRLARLAARNGTAIGICHVRHPYALQALQALQVQLRARGYVFAPLSQVTNGPTPGLDSGVRPSL